MKHDYFKASVSCYNNLTHEGCSPLTKIEGSYFVFLFFPAFGLAKPISTGGFFTHLGSATGGRNRYVRQPSPPSTAINQIRQSIDGGYHLFLATLGLGFSCPCTWASSSSGASTTVVGVGLFLHPIDYRGGWICSSGAAGNCFVLR
jgi:hypothetical protein